MAKQDSHSNRHSNKAYDYLLALLAQTNDKAHLSEILKESGEVGDMELEIFKFHVKSLDSYERELINVV